MNSYHYETREQNPAPTYNYAHEQEHVQSYNYAEPKQAVQTSSAATQELDDLMSTLSDFKVSSTFIERELI